MYHFVPSHPGYRKQLPAGVHRSSSGSTSHHQICSSCCCAGRDSSNSVSRFSSRPFKPARYVLDQSILPSYLVTFQTLEGPVLLDLPIDVLFSPVHPKLIAWGSITSSPTYPPGPHREAIDAAAQLIRNAKRPAIITGTGARSFEVTLLCI